MSSCILWYEIGMGEVGMARVVFRGRLEGFRVWMMDQEGLVVMSRNGWSGDC